MQSIGILLAKFQEEFGVNVEDLSVIPSVTSVGGVLGTLLFGRICDQAGRKLGYHLSLSMCVLFGFLSSFAGSVHMYAAFRFLMGVGYGGNVVSAATLLIESTPTAWRGFFAALTSFAFTFGGLFISLFSWAFMDRLGWAHVVRVTSLIGFPVVVFLFFMPGSPRFYIAKGRFHEAVAVVERVARTNGKEMPPFFTTENLRGQLQSSDLNEDIPKVQAPRGFLSTLLRTSQGATLVVLMFIWFTNSFGLAIFFFLPLELEKRFPEVQRAEYKVSTALSLGGIFGSFVVTYLSTRMRRIIEMRMGLFILTTCVFSLSISTSFPLDFAILMVNHVGMSIVFHSLYTFTPESFQTSVRVRAFSFCHVAHRIAPIVAPFLAARLTEISFALCAKVFSSFWVFAAISTCFLNRETMDLPLREDFSSDEKDVKYIEVDQLREKEENNDLAED